jgi:hypothetical protein
MTTTVRLRLTGKRTGLTSYVIPNVGVVNEGDTFDVDEETAERYLVEHPTGDGSLASDFERAGGKASDGPALPKDVDADASDQPADDADGGK